MSRSSKFNQIDMTELALTAAVNDLPEQRRKDAKYYLKLLIESNLTEAQLRLVESLIDISWNGGVAAHKSELRGGQPNPNSPMNWTVCRNGKVMQSATGEDYRFYTHSMAKLVYDRVMDGYSGDDEISLCWTGAPMISNKSSNG